MKKNELERWLRSQLSDLPKGEVDGILIFYTSAIEDRMEDGMTEEEAVSALGDPEAILAEIRASRPMTYSPSRPPKGKKRGLWAAGAALLALGVALAVYSVAASATGFRLFGRNSDDPEAVWDHSSQVTVYEEANEPEFLMPGDSLAEEMGWEAVDDGEYSGYRIPHDLADSIFLSCDAGGIQMEGWSEPYYQALFLYPQDYGLSTSDGCLWIYGEDLPYRNYNKRPAVLLRAPESELAELQLNVDAGNLQITGVTVAQMFLEVDAGNITLERVLALETLNIEADAGNVLLRSVASDGDLSVQVDAGNIELSQVDAMASLGFITDAGSITGTLASPAGQYSWEAKVDVGASNLARQVVNGPVSLYLQVSIGNIDVEFAPEGQSRQVWEGTPAQTAAMESGDTAGIAQNTAGVFFEPPSPPQVPDVPDAPVFTEAPDVPEAPSVWLFGRSLQDLLPWNW